MEDFVHVNQHFEKPEIRSSGKLPFIRFLFRYPVFLLAFGPPILRDTRIDATKGTIDVWTIIQIGWISLITVRALMRLLSAREILVPKPVRSILRLFIILGLLYTASVAYSPSRSVSAAYTALYFFTLICMVEFITDAFKNPPDWVQCLMHLRFIYFLLFIAVLLTLPFKPLIVMLAVPGIGIRLLGGAVAPLFVVCPMIAIISGYAFLFSLESKTRSVFFFLVGLGGTLITQSRGGEIALLVSLAVLGFMWAGSSRRSNYLFLATSFGFALLIGALLATGGGSRVWSLFNRGESMQNVESASGRTDIWMFTIHYCMAHPLGMGYIAGFRVIFRDYFALGLQVITNRIGDAHNILLNALAGAGWPALAVFLILLFKICALGCRYARKRAIFTTASEDLARHALRCTLALFAFCMIDGIDTGDFSLPLRASFYSLNIIFALILTISARMIAESRYHNSALTR